MTKESLFNNKPPKKRLPIRLAHNAFKKLHMGEDISDEECEALFDSYYVKADQKTVYAHPAINEKLYKNSNSQDKKWVKIILPDLEEELIQYLCKNPKLLYEISPRKFEELVAAIFRNQGFTVELTPQTRDGGFDIFAVQHNELIGKSTFIVECKRYAPKNKVGIGTVQRMYGVVESLRANKGIIATTSSFSKDAALFAQKTQYKLVLQDYQKIKDWLRLCT